MLKSTINHKLQSKPKTTDDLKVALLIIWEELQQERIKGSGKLHQALDCINGYDCHWWSLR